MVVGVPGEIKDNENRVALTPAGAEALCQAGHRVVVEAGAGARSGFPDEEYAGAGADLSATAADVFGAAELVLKVKEPQPVEYALLRRGQVLFTYLHLAPDPELTRALLERGVIGVAYETVELPDRTLPLLTPMSEIAGRMSVQVGAHFLERPHGGKGILMSGVPGVPPAHVVIVGGGVVGTNAARVAVGMGARVTLLDINASRLQHLDDVFGSKLETVMSSSHALREAVADADLLVGAVLVPGAKAPRLVTEEMVKSMEPGSVIVDVAVDQGGCVETIDRVTTHSHPVYEKHGVLHYSVANMPGAVPRTSTLALTNVTLPYAVALANKGWARAARDDRALARGVNLLDGKITHAAVAEALGSEYHPVDGFLQA